MKLSEINAALRDLEISPSKSLGQNFLHDQNLVRSIVDQADLSADDFVLEIGPGLGSLTEFILQRGARVLAIEKDSRLANFLRQRLVDSRLEVLNMDALDFDVHKLFTERRVKFIGNLPYSISNPLLMKYLEYPSPICLWILTLQKEVAQRLSASPSTKEYGALTLLVQLRYSVEYVRTLPPRVFLPEPEVDSALVQITPRDPAELPARDNDLFAKLVRSGFSQRRKQLQKLLRAQIPEWDCAAETLGFTPKARAEQLSLIQWIGLTNLAAAPAFSDTRAFPQERFPVVDEQDRILRYAYRAEVHANNLRHRAVHIFIFDDTGRVFLQQRARDKDRYPLRWDSSTGGHVSANEGYDDAARRELLEELGIAVSLEKITKLPASDRTDQEFICLYQSQYRGDPRPNRNEIEAGAFFSPTIVDSWIAARSRDFTPAFLECWKTYRERKPD